MKNLIIITGISGSGKSTLAKKMYTELNKKYVSVYISLDCIKESINDAIGFSSNVEKVDNNIIAYTHFKALIETAMKRKVQNIIVEYPFDVSKWNTYFADIKARYNYTSIIVNMYTTNFDKLWERLIERNNSIRRHPSHNEEHEYHYGKQYKRGNQIDYQEHLEKYKSHIYTSLDGDIVIDFDESGELYLVVKKIEESDIDIACDDTFADPYNILSMKKRNVN